MVAGGSVDLSDAVVAVEVATARHRRARERPDDPVGDQPVRALELLDGLLGLRAQDAVGGEPERPLHRPDPSVVVVVAVAACAAPISGPVWPTRPAAMSAAEIRAVAVLGKAINLAWRLRGVGASARASGPTARAGRGRGPRAGRRRSRIGRP